MNPGIDHRSGPSTEIDGCQAESLVHGHEKVSGPQNATSISQRAVEDCAQSNPNVFHGVVLIHFQVAHGFELQIESTVPCKQLQHVVQKVDSSRNVVFPMTAETEIRIALTIAGHGKYDVCY